MLLKIKRLNDLSRCIERQYLSAGYDLFPAISGSIPPGTAQLIPLGFCTEFPYDHVGLVLDRSSVGMKGCGRLAGVIDCDYRGEWKILLARFPLTVVEQQHNEIVFLRGELEPFDFTPDKAIAQVLFVPLADVTLEIVSELSLTDRGGRMNGSSDNLVKLGQTIDVGLGMKARPVEDIQ